jgi:hypothetical protein
MQMLTVTDSDHLLAAELGLVLDKRLETEADRKLAADPRATRVPQTWEVKSVLTHRPVGRLYFTPVDCLYATKLAAGISGIEETVADALRWIAPVVGHVRTGEYDGTETVMIAGNLRTRPRAITECGAPATGADYNRIAARSELVNGTASEMCPACRAKLEARGVRDLSHLPGRSRTATVKQQDYLRRLLDEGAQHGRPHLVDARLIDKMSSREASATIDQLRALKTRGWKGDL